MVFGIGISTRKVIIHLVDLIEEADIFEINKERLSDVETGQNLDINPPKKLINIILIFH